MKILSKIDEIIKAKFKMSFSSTKGGYILEEAEVSNYPDTLIKSKGKLLVYSFDTKDSNDTVFPLFNAKVPGLTVINDYLIFCPKDEVLYVFICDLKSSSTSATKQLNSGKILAEFLLNTAIKELDFFPLEVEYRGLIFTKKNNPMMKTSTKPQKYSLLERSQLKKQILKAGTPCYLDNLCF